MNKSLMVLTILAKYYRDFDEFCSKVIHPLASAIMIGIIIFAMYVAVILYNNPKGRK